MPGTREAFTARPREVGARRGSHLDDGLSLWSFGPYHGLKLDIDGFMQRFAA